MSLGELTKDDLDEFLGWLDEVLQFHMEKVEAARQNKNAAQHTVQLLRQWQLESAPTGDGGGPSHFGVTASDVVNCATIREAMVVIASGNNGYLRYRTAARVIKEAKLSKSRNLNHLAKDLSRLADRDKDWEKDSPGVYRYLPYVQRDPDGTKPEKAAKSVLPSTAHLPPSPHFGRGADDPN